MSSLVNLVVSYFKIETHLNSVGNQNKLNGIFDENIALFVAKGIDANTCIQKCRNAAFMSLTESDCMLTMDSQEKIQSVLDQFGKRLEQNQKLAYIDYNIFCGTFKKCFAEPILEKWVELLTRRFYEISLVTNSDKRTIDFKTWSKEFGQGIAYFSKMQAIRLDLSYQNSFFTKACEALRVHVNRLQQDKLHTIVLSADKNPQLKFEFLDLSGQQNLEQSLLQYDLKSAFSQLKKWITGIQ